MPVIDSPNSLAGVARKVNYAAMSPAAQRALAAADQPVTKSRFLHETDVGNVDSIRKTGIRPSTGGSAMGHEGVYAYEGGYPKGRTIPKGRAVIEFQADPHRISGRGTTPGSRTVALGGGDIASEDVLHGYTSKGQIFDAGSTAVLLAQLASMLPQVRERLPRTSWALQGGPLGDAANQTVGATMKAAGLDRRRPSYTPWGDPMYYDNAGNTIA
jgi:hypothetical protein